MSFANALKKAASKTLSKLGGDVTIRQVTAGSYNTTTGAITESTSDTTIKGALTNVNKSEVNDLIESQDTYSIVSNKFEKGLKLLKIIFFLICTLLIK